MPCPQLRTCNLERHVTMNALRVWQSFYCEGCFDRCERLKLARAGAQFPETLLPNGRFLETVDPEVLAAIGRR
jgi:hypothetical protein